MPTTAVIAGTRISHATMNFASLRKKSAIPMRSNGEVEGPLRSARSSAAGAQFLPRPRRVTTDRSRTPPTIVRGHAVLTKHRVVSVVVQDHVALNSGMVDVASVFSPDKVVD
jgi:hypothetical protein